MVLINARLHRVEVAAEGPEGREKAALLLMKRCSQGYPGASYSVVGSIVKHGILLAQQVRESTIAMGW